MALVELLVAAALLALLIMITDAVLLGMYRVSQATHQAADLQQNARAAAARLRRELRESWAPAIVCHPDPLCAEPSTQVVFPSARPSEEASLFCLDIASDDPWRRPLESTCTFPVPMTGSYEPVPQRSIGYHLSAGELRRVVRARPISLPISSSSGQVVATNVMSFVVSRAGRLMRIHLTFLSPGAGGAGGVSPQQMRLEDMVELRNEWPDPGARA